MTLFLAAAALAATALTGVSLTCRAVFGVGGALVCRCVWSCAPLPLFLPPPLFAVWQAQVAY